MRPELAIERRIRQRKDFECYEQGVEERKAAHPTGREVAIGKEIKEEAEAERAKKFMASIGIVQSW
jgi:hypothetical protein